MSLPSENNRGEEFTEQKICHDPSTARTLEIGAKCMNVENMTYGSCTGPLLSLAAQGNPDIAAIHKIEFIGQSSFIFKNVAALLQPPCTN
jgi:hypothetical protein